ncbi:MAG: triphosphoribosyl-dephospho-CoA synthase MdcB [Burkholderiales bacterium]
MLSASVSSTPTQRAFETDALRIGRAAIVSLYDELALAPKPGLVSFVDAGSHSDMDASTFMRSLFALRHYFAGCARLGAERAPFAELEALGIAAEARMLQATAGVNTHRGAVFTLGLLCAAAGRLDEPCTPLALRQSLRTGWGEALELRRSRSATTNGQRAARTLGLRGAGDEAALGFPVLFEHALPALAHARRSGLDDRHARLHTLFEIMSVLADTNLAHRGGIAGLRYAQSEARNFLRAGGAMQPDALAHARSIHRAFVERHLSPGGAADVLAAASLVERICRSA